MRGSDDWIQSIFNEYVKAPIIVLIGMVIVGALIDAVLGTGNTFKIMLVSIGGIGVVAKYFLKFWQHKAN
jgi:hypothetical protein